MKAYQLLAKLKLLTLAGYEKGEGFIWVGPDKLWNMVEKEEESILRDWELSDNVFFKK